MPRAKPPGKRVVRPVRLIDERQVIRIPRPRLVVVAEKAGTVSEPQQSARSA